VITGLSKELISKVVSSRAARYFPLEDFFPGVVEEVSKLYPDVRMMRAYTNLVDRLFPLGGRSKYIELLLNRESELAKNYYLNSIINSALSMGLSPEQIAYYTNILL